MREEFGSDEGGEVLASSTPAREGEAVEMEDVRSDESCEVEAKDGGDDLEGGEVEGEGLDLDLDER